MSKKSRKTAAARYSELSRDRRKKRERKPVQSTPVQPLVAEEPVEQVSRSSPARSSPRQEQMKLAAGAYRYVREDLKRVGIIAGGMVLVLIVLAFVLD